jgi:hypothetical protein
MFDQHPVLLKDTLSRASAPITAVQPTFTISDDQYESFTYRKWLARQTGLSPEQAITRGLATRDHSTRWKATCSSDGLWHLSPGNPS